MIALDTAPNPANTADITFATDNIQAGKLIGQYGGQELDGKKAVIAMLDLFNNQVVSVDIQRDHGFLDGMGIDPGSTTQNGKEAKSGKYIAAATTRSPATSRHRARSTADVRRWRPACPANPNINVVYAINEPAAEGAYNALKAPNKQNDVTVVAIDGCCDGLRLRRLRRVRRRLGPVPRQDGRARRRGDRQAGPRRRQADADQRQGLLRHRHEPGHDEARRSREPARRTRREGVLGQLTPARRRGGAHVSSRRRSSTDAGTPIPAIGSSPVSSDSFRRNSVTAS